MKFPENKHYRNVFAFVVVLAVLGAGCSSDEENGEGIFVSGPIQVDGIIFNPKSIAPGDTVQLTGIVTGNSAPGDFVTFRWSAFDGTSAVHDSFFIESDRTTVRWVAPPGSQIYELRVDASNSVSSSAATSRFFVGGLTPFINDDAGEIHLTPSGDAYYLSTPDEPETFRFEGLHVRFQVAGGGNSAVTADSRGTGSLFRLSSDLQYETHTTPSTTDDLANQELGDLVPTGGSITTVAKDMGSPLRPDLFSIGSFSPDDQSVTYSSQLTDNINFPPVNVDSFAILTYDINASTTYRATYPHHGNCFYSTFSPAGDQLVFLSDLAGVLEWEYYAIPVSGAVPDTSSSVIVKLTNSGGLMGSASALPANQLSEWNGNATTPVMAALDVDGTLWMIPASGGASKSNVTGRVRGFGWSWDGERLAAHKTNQLIVVNKSGAIEMSYAAPAGDLITLPSWSPDGNLLVYNVQRLSDTWWEVWDFGGVTGLSEPIQITGASSAGSIASYTSVEDIRPVWEAGTLKAYLLFFDGSSPSASSIDLAGLIPGP